jgi:peptidoglycan/LPS O-acetylase OafA/YrhL
LLTYDVLAPAHRAMVNRMLHSSIDTIMFGCLLALLWKSERFNRLLSPWMDSWTGSWIMAGSALFLLVLDPILDYRLHGSYNLLAGMTLEGIAICLVMLYVVRRPGTVSGRVLNLAPVRHIGIVSYSLYLWQNIIIGKGERYFPWDLIALLAAAELSYWVVERPALRLRDRVEKWRTARKVAPLQPLTIEITGRQK